MTRHSDTARTFASLVHEHGTQKEAARAAGVSAATFSRYLKLLSLDDDTLARVDTGELPVRNTLDAVAKEKGRAKQKIATSLSDELTKLLELVKEHTLLTTKQAAAFAGVSETKIRGLIQHLKRLKLIDSHDEIRPYVYRLSARGAAMTNASFQRRWLSASAMHQIVLLNNIELRYREKTTDYRFVKRANAWRAGLHPAHGEHILKIKGKWILVLIDDYGMPPSRIVKVLNKPHSPNRKYYTGATRRYRDFVEQAVVYCTDETHAKRHLNMVKKHMEKGTAGVRKINVQPIQAVWGVV